MKQTFEPFVTISDEIWKVITGYEKYMVSNLGRVRIGNYILKPMINDKGYCEVSISPNGVKRRTRVLVHRLVASTFLENPDNKPEVDHIDTVKENNALSNLRWCWHLENMMDNKLTLEKLDKNPGFKKKSVYISIGMDLCYSKRNCSEIKYSDHSIQLAEEITGKSIKELLDTTPPHFNWGNSTVQKKPKKEKKKKLVEEYKKEDIYVPPVVKETIVYVEKKEKERPLIILPSDVIQIGMKVKFHNRIYYVKYVDYETKNLVIKDFFKNTEFISFSDLGITTN